MVKPAQALERGIDDELVTDRYSPISEYVPIHSSQCALGLFHANAALSCEQRAHTQPCLQGLEKGGSKHTITITHL